MSETLVLPNPAITDPKVFQIHQEQTGLEVDWFKKAQAAAWERYLELPLPVRTDEKWRFANLKRLKDLGNYHPASLSEKGSEALKRSIMTSQAASCSAITLSGVRYTLTPCSFFNTRRSFE